MLLLVVRVDVSFSAVIARWLTALLCLLFFISLIDVNYCDVRFVDLVFNLGCFGWFV